MRAFTGRLCTMMLLLLSCTTMYGQNELAAPAPDSSNTKKAHRLLLRKQKSKYMDDQLYIGFTYNILTSKPEEVDNYSFSNTLSFGYIRDIPLNKRRNIGLGVGVGVGFHTYYTNLAITRDVIGSLDVSVMNKGEYKSNRFTMQTLDIPIQIRFRGSTAEKFNFWRVYGGVTASWVYKNFSTLKDDVAKTRYYGISPARNWLFSANLQVGYGKFTVKVDYLINSIFDKTIKSYNISGLDKMNSCNVGLLVYLL